MAEEVEIGQHKYQLGRLNAFDQFHVWRRVGPLMTELQKGIAAIPDDLRAAAAEGEAAAGEGDGDGQVTSEADDETGAQMLMAVIGPVIETLSKMTDADCEYVIKKCLAKVTMQNPDGRWVPVMSHGMFMFENIMDMQVMMRLTIAMIRENLSGFFSATAGLDLSGGGLT